MLLKIIFLAIFFTGCFCDDEPDDSYLKPKPKPEHPNCNTLNNKFITANFNFTRCVLRHNEEATFCTDCVRDYANILEAFNNLATGSEPIDNDPRITIKCRDLFIDNNQLNIVEDILSSSKHLWGSGFCSDCFVPECDLSKYTAENCTLSNRTSTFEQLWSDTNACIDGKNNSWACENCTEVYGNLNKKYDEIRLKTANKFCFTIKYWMNTTQFRWANETGCCSDRQPIMTDFFVTSSFSIVISIMFYIATFIIGKRNERVQCIPDDLMPPGHSNQSNDTVMNINPAQEPSTSEDQGGPTDNDKIINTQADSISSDGGEDEDEEILPIENQNLIQI